MKVAIVGAGGVGGYFGGVLAQAGCDVTVLARGDHLAAIKSHGLKIQTLDGSVLNPSVNAIGHTDCTDPCDLVIVAVKGWQIDDAIEPIRRLSHTESVILPLLNGIDAPGLLQAALPDRRVIGGLCGIIAAIKEPGVISHMAIDPFITFGAINADLPVPQNTLEEVKSVFDSAGIDAKISQDITLSMWRKFLFICPLSAVTSVARGTIGEVRSIPETADLLQQCIQEVIAVGKENGIGLNDDHRKSVLKQISSSPADGTTSMQRDINTLRPSELDTQLGAVIKLGKKCGVATPALSFIYSALIPQELAARRAGQK